jgi:hypothetical protein
MTRTNDDQSMTIRKTPYPIKDFRALVPPDPAHIKTCNTYVSLISTIEKHSFVVPWQISTVENCLHFKGKFDADNHVIN